VKGNIGSLGLTSITNAKLSEVFSSLGGDIAVKLKKMMRKLVEIIYTSKVILPAG